MRISGYQLQSPKEGNCYMRELNSVEHASARAFARHKAHSKLDNLTESKAQLMVLSGWPQIQGILVDAEVWHMKTLFYTHTHIHAHALTHAKTYARIHADTHTHTQTHTRTCRPSHTACKGNVLVLALTTSNASPYFADSRRSPCQHLEQKQKQANKK